MSPIDFNRLPLHDATLKSICIDWETKLCTIDCVTHVGTRKIQFDGVTSFETTLQDSWGPSSYVLRCAQGGGVDRIEMQSGDVVRVA
jgi:hypothetical protein